MNDKDKSITDAARLHKVTLQNGDIQQFVYRWDETLSLMTKQPDDEDLMNLLVLQFDAHPPKNHEFYGEYLLWYTQPTGSPKPKLRGPVETCPRLGTTQKGCEEPQRVAERPLARTYHWSIHQRLSNKTER